MNSPTITVRLSLETLEALETLASDQGVTKSAIVQQAIASLLTPQPLLTSLGISQADQETLEVLAARQGCTVATLVNIATIYYIDYHKGLGTVHSMLKQLKSVLTDTATVQLPIPSISGEMYSLPG